MADIINLEMEPIVVCNCDHSLWYLIANPEADKVPRKVIAFKCGSCGFRIETRITMEDFDV